MRHLCADVDGMWNRLNGIHVLGKGLPVEIDAFGQGGAGNVLDAFHDADQKLMTIRPDGRKPDAAVAHHYRCHPVP